MIEMLSLSKEDEEEEKNRRHEVKTGHMLPIHHIPFIFLIWKFAYGIEKQVHI